MAQKKQCEKGFSLMEVIVALFVIVTALAGLMSLIIATVASGNSSSAKLIAANLAQEGIEIVKSVRDLNYGANGWDDWYAGFSGANYYLAQYSDTALRPFSDTFLKYDSAAGLYSYDSGSDTIYKRKITIVKNPGGLDDNELQVFSVVTWIERGQSKSLTVEDRLWNWR